MKLLNAVVPDVLRLFSRGFLSSQSPESDSPTWVGALLTVGQILTDCSQIQSAFWKLSTLKAAIKTWQEVSIFCQVEWDMAGWISAFMVQYMAISWAWTVVLLWILYWGSKFLFCPNQAFNQKGVHRPDSGLYDTMGGFFVCISGGMYINNQHPSHRWRQITCFFFFRGKKLVSPMGGIYCVAFLEEHKKLVIPNIDLSLKIVPRMRGKFLWKDTKSWGSPSLDLTVGTVTTVESTPNSWLPPHHWHVTWVMFSIR